MSERLNELEQVRYLDNEPRQYCPYAGVRLWSEGGEQCISSLIFVELGRRKAVLCGR